MSTIKSSSSFFRRLLRWPGKLFNTRVRLSFAMACGVLTLVLLSQAIGLVPDHNQPKMDARKLQTETLAITGSAIAEAKGGALRDFRKTLQNTVDRADDLLSVGLRDGQGKLVFEINDHKTRWSMPNDNRSNDRFMFVPIHRGNKQIAQLELCYEPLVSVKSWLQSSTARLALFLFLLSFVTFNLILHRTLKQLDPRGAVPKRVREAFDAMAEGLLILDRKGEIMLANEKFCSLVGIEKNEKLVGNSITNFPWQTVSHQLPWIEAMKTHTAVTDAIVEIENADHKICTFSVSAAPVLAQYGRSRGVIVTFDDITLLEEHKRELVDARKAADDANEAKSNFLSRMSHEIRTPMNAIIGYTDILQQGETSSSDQVRYLTTIQSSGEHLLSLINDILDLSKIEAGQMTIEQRLFPLIPILTQVIDTLIGKASEYGLYLNLEMEGNVPDQITTDETRLRQILINTIGNAIKFTKNGGVTLVARYLQNNGQNVLEFDVRDTGIGISQSALETIFNPFSQADDSVTRKFGGTGLGLAITKQLCEAMGGSIRVASQEGVGTTFTVAVDPGELPDGIRWITNENLLAAMKQPAERKTIAHRFERGHVLVVDDGQANRDLAGLMLKRIGLTHEVAVNGRDALEKLVKGNFDVVLMDMHMPIMDGMTATKHIRHAELNIPIVALTALVVEEEKQKCLTNGCNAFLSKPIRIEPLVKVLAQYLPLKEPRNASLGSTGETASRPAIKNDDEADIDSCLSDTLMSLGIDLDEPEQNQQQAGGQLVLPDLVTSSFGNDAEIVPIIEGFVERLNQRIVEFQVALENNDLAELSDLGHWLAGATATVGYDQFVDAARELEHSDGSDPNRIKELVDYLTELTRRIDLNLESKMVPNA